MSDIFVQVDIKFIRYRVMIVEDFVVGLNNVYAEIVFWSRYLLFAWVK